MLKKILQISALTLTFLGAVQSTKKEGACEVIELQPDFDATRYVGTWYEQVRDKTFNFESYDCNQAHYTLNQDGSIAVLNSEFNEAKGKIETAKATAKCNGAQCKVYFVPFVGGDYRVLSTDYENYSIVYSCEDSFLGKSSDELIWVLARQPQLSEEIKTKVN